MKHVNLEPYFLLCGPHPSTHSKQCLFSCHRVEFSTNLKGHNQWQAVLKRGNMTWIYLSGWSIICSPLTDNALLSVLCTLDTDAHRVAQFHAVPQSLPIKEWFHVRAVPLNIVTQSSIQFEMAGNGSTHIYVRQRMRMHLISVFYTDCLLYCQCTDCESAHYQHKENAGLQNIHVFHQKMGIL